jgi:hypothetical protein
MDIDSRRSGTAVSLGRAGSTAVALLIASAAVAGPPAGSGLAPSQAEISPWASLQWRVIPSSLPALAPQASRDGPRGLLGSALVADLYLSPSGLGPRFQGGLRATSGLMAGGPTSQPGLTLSRANTASMPLPYLGLGYSGLHSPTGWGLTADLGLVAATPGAIRFGRSSFASGPALEDAVRDLRLTPVLRLGVSYAF